jgi:prepilin-type processing-associated H-X9-DG protein
MREKLRVRMPDLANAPLLEARVCQYEDTPDKTLIIDRHPEAANVWFVGGGSGHKFKLAPALGVHVAQLIVAPLGLRECIVRLIGEQTEEAQKGELARITSKMNALTDPRIIESLY